MVPADEPSGTAPGDAAPDSASLPWRDQAVARSLDSARLRVEQRVQRFLDATTDLIREKGGLDFTVQEVVERSQQSLRSFYQSFEGKQHLLMAVYEEAMYATSIEMRAVVGDSGRVIDRLRTFVTTLYAWSEREPLEVPPRHSQTIRAMAEFVFEQLVSDPNRAVTATAPLFDFLVDLVIEAQTEGTVTSGPPRRLAALVLQSTMFCAFGAVLQPEPAEHHNRADEMWAFCSHGLTRP